MKRVLIIDDEPLVRRSLSRVLKMKGFEVFEACDGVEGLKAWKHCNPELVFLDVLMPHMSGPEVLSEIGITNCKVILISAYSGQHNLQTAMKMGADLFIAKPFEDIFKVVAQAQELLDGR